ncbi:MAG: SpoIVB peptidase [Firmicutes bacterium]|nr:SpoIVB peptidase [Bacillota bacterium]
MPNFWKRRSIFILVLLVFSLSLFFSQTFKNNLASDLQLFEGQEYSYRLKFPLHLYIKADKSGILDINGNVIHGNKLNHLGMHKDLALRGLNSGDVNLELSLFKGLLPIRQLTVSVLPEIRLNAGGHSIGIKLHDEGVVVVGYFYAENEEGKKSPAEDSGVLIGDLILAVNGIGVHDLNTAARVIKRESAKGALDLLLKREGKKINVKVIPYPDPSGKDYRIGLYIRDTAAGVGTLTFYDLEKQYYGALGHIITDSDTHTVMEIDNGLIVRADIVNVKMAQRGQPGEKAGVFREEKDILGSIAKNTHFGIYGKLKNIEKCATPYPDPIPLGLSFEAELGPAEMLTVVEGNKIQSFKLEIEKTLNQNRPVDKGIVFRVVDEKLLSKTGGIVQGMSGSPIIQNGRLIGAVTHVFINDPARGYGIFAEWMVKEMELLPVS